MYSHFNLPSMRLSAQIFVSTIGVLLVVALFSVFAERRDEYDHMEELARIQAQEIMSIVGTLTAKPIASNDISAVKGVMQEFVTLSKSLEYVAIIEQSGSMIAAFPENPADKTGHISEFREEFK